MRFVRGSWRKGSSDGSNPSALVSGLAAAHIEMVATRSTQHVEHNREVGMEKTRNGTDTAGVKFVVSVKATLLILLAAASLATGFGNGNSPSTSIYGFSYPGVML